MDRIQEVCNSTRLPFFLSETGTGLEIMVNQEHQENQEDLQEDQVN